MTANTSPIYTGTPNFSWSNAITAANTATDGTGTVLAAHTAGANGSFVQKVRFQSLGTNVASIGRVFVNNGLTNGTAANNVLVGEVILPATTLSQTAGMSVQELPLNFTLPAGYIINVCLGTAVSAGYNVWAVGGNY